MLQGIRGGFRMPFELHAPKAFFHQHLPMSFAHSAFSTMTPSEPQQKMITAKKKCEPQLLPLPEKLMFLPVCGVTVSTPVDKIQQAEDDLKHDMKSFKCDWSLARTNVLLRKIDGVIEAGGSLDRYPFVKIFIDAAFDNSNRHLFVCGSSSAMSVLKRLIKFGACGEDAISELICKFNSPRYFDVKCAVLQELLSHPDRFDVNFSDYACPSPLCLAMKMILESSNAAKGIPYTKQQTHELLELLLNEGATFWSPHYCSPRKMLEAAVVNDSASNEQKSAFHRNLYKIATLLRAQG